MFCPKCQAEYLPEFSQCADCEIALVPVLDRETNPAIVSIPSVVVFTTSNIYEANLVKGLLEANGIQAQLLGGHLSTLNPLLTNAVGGIQIGVPATEAELANELLQTYRTPHGDDPNFGAATPFSFSEYEKKKPAETGTPRERKEICSACGAKPEPDSNFCDQCGMEL